MAVAGGIIFRAKVNGLFNGNQTRLGARVQRPAGPGTRGGGGRIDAEKGNRKREDAEKGISAVRRLSKWAAGLRASSVGMPLRVFSLRR
jgi:hypothetical protein